MPSLLNEEQLSKKEKDLLWKNGVNSKNPECIKNAIKQGVMPRYLNATFLIKDANDLDSYKSLMELLLETNVLKEDSVYFDLADSLLKKGARLPNLFLERSSFYTTSNYYVHLAQCPHDLYIALRSNPGISKARDEQGMTILHHAAKTGTIINADKAHLIRYLLFTTARVDLNAQDKQGNTPLHLAAFCDVKDVMRPIYLSDFINKACEFGLNLFILNKQDQSVLTIIEQQLEKLSLTGSQTETEYKKELIKKRLEELFELRDRLRMIARLNNQSKNEHKFPIWKSEIDGKENVFNTQIDPGQ